MVKELRKSEQSLRCLCEYERRLPEMLRAIRLALGLSQADIAYCLKISRSTYTYYECGKTVPSFYTLVAIAMIFGVPSQVFYDQKLYLEILENRETKQKRPTREVAKKTSQLGELSSEERYLIAQARISGIESVRKTLLLATEEELV